MTRAFEVFVLRGGAYETVAPDAAGVVSAPRFDLQLSVVEGPKLRVAWADGAAEI